MSINPRINYKAKNIIYEMQDFFNTNKGKVIICAFACVISILTGVLTAIKLSSSGVGISLDNFSLIIFVDGEAHTISVLFSRFLSCVIVALLLLIFSKNYFLSILGYAILVYRGYLLGINCAVLIVCCGFGGILNSILVIFPCQFIIMCLLCLMFCLMMSNNIYKNKYGICKNSFSNFKILLIILSIIFVICIIEAILLLILQATVILVI